MTNEFEPAKWREVEARLLKHGPFRAIAHLAGGGFCEGIVLGIESCRDSVTWNGELTLRMTEDDQGGRETHVHEHELAVLSFEPG